ncbi:hypothetical protein PISL3812_09132 [Talaromyces islandicus]|uniref:Carrier domain-containing protein n=1 Tax=Talaromyces islandicus TaxID=28573 RepID=A0A0U1M8Y7_TALIS|nr:hypothetical protein PISL3812_09132 [Talaromyces islandicus]
MAASKKARNRTQEIILQSVASVLNHSLTESDLDVSFFELGGNSIRAVLLHSTCKEKGIDLKLTSIISCRTIHELFGAATLAPPQQQHPATVKTNEIALATPPEEDSTASHILPSASLLEQAIENASSKNSAPISHMQLLLLHGSQKNVGTNVIRYHEEYALCHLAQMKTAWAAVVESEPVFRLAFNFANNTQHELDLAPFTWIEKVVDTEDEYQSNIHSHSSPSDGYNSFTVTIFADEGKFTITWHIHHALMDGYSRDLILNKVRQAAVGKPILPGNSFIGLARELEAFRTQNRESARQFWGRQNKDYFQASGNLVLSPPTTDSVKHRRTKTINTSLRSQDILYTASKCGTTVASLIHAAWALVVSKYTSSETVEFGTVLSGRSIPLKNNATTAGPMINTLPFRARVSPHMSVREFVQGVSKQMVELISFEWSTPEDGFERNFSTALAVEGISEPGVGDNDSIRPMSEPSDTVDTEIPLSLIARSDGNIRLRYHANVFHDRDVNIMADVICRAMDALADPEARLSDCLLSLLGTDARKYLLSLGNCLSPLTSVGSVTQDLVTLFESIARKYPTHVACQKDDQCLTYSELDVAAAKVASVLASFVHPGDVVCIRPSPSFNWMIGIYGILKARAVYSPLDGSLPLSIQEDNFKTASAKVFLTADHSAHTWQPTTCAIARSISDILSTTELNDITTSHRSIPEPSANAYLCFTSGSSGKPKGVIATHEGLVAFQRNEEVRLFANPGTKISQLMSPAFDGSIHEIFSALSYGATLVLNDSANPFDVLHLVDSAILTPSVANVLDPSDYPDLKAVYLVGEPVSETVSTKWASQKDLYNMYGPTEATCGATIKKLRPHEPVTLGIPQPSMRIYILDQNRSLAMPGVTGEICLAGIQVTRGYIGRPEETARSFIPDTVLADRQGEYVYRTGDLGYWNGNGELVCLGRADRQIKLQGFRLNLNDLETRVCRALPEVKAIAIARHGDFLVAMVEPGSLDIAELRSNLLNILPAYAMPSHITAVNSFPKTNAGKLDYKAVAEMAARRTTTTTTTEPLSQVDLPSAVIIADMWRTLLNLGPDVKLDPTSNFMTLGGDSIKQLQLASILRQSFGSTIPLHTLIQNTTTLGRLAQAVEHLSKTSISLCINPLGQEALSPIELEWYQKSTFTRHASAFNVSYGCEIGNNIDRVRLAQAWNAVLKRHRILSSRFVERAGKIVREYGEHPPRARRLAKLDIRHEINRAFSLGCEDPIRVLISRNRMLVVVHHIVCDLTTLRTLIREMVDSYNGTSLAAAPPRSYADVTTWSESVSPGILDFWSDYLGKKVNSATAPRQEYNGQSHVTRVSSTLHKDIVEFSTRRNVTLHQLALAAVSIALQHDQDDIDVVLGAPFMNRTSAEDLDTVGLFLEPLPIRIQYSSEKSHSLPSGNSSNAQLRSPSLSPSPSPSSSNSFLQAVSESSQTALAHSVPWNQLLTHLSVPQTFPTHPLFDTMVTYLEQDQMPTKPPLPGLNPLYLWTEGSKFKLMVEFMAVSDETLLMRCEYDTNYYTTENEIKRLEKRVARALRGLVDEREFDQVRAMAREVNAEDDMVQSFEDLTDESTIFGRRMDRL